MDNLQDIFQTFFRLILCISPFVILLIVVISVAFAIYYFKKQRKKRLQTALNKIYDIQFPGIDAIIQSGSNPDVPFTKTLVDGALLLQDMTEGNTTPLEKRSLNTFVQELTDYKQRASFGKLPNPELSTLRQTELQRIEFLRTAISCLIDTAEKGNAKAVYQHLYEADSIVIDVYNGNTDLKWKATSAGIEFPLPQPTNLPTRDYIQKEKSTKGIFNKPVNGNTGHLTLNEREAFVAISLLIIGADGYMGEEEIVIAAAGITRMRLFRGYDPEIRRVFDLIQHHGVGTITQAAKATLSPELRETAFTLAVDVGLADGYLDETEQNYLTQLYQGLEIPEGLATKIVEVIKIKNRG